MMQASSMLRVQRLSNAAALHSRSRFFHSDNNGLRRFPYWRRAECLLIPLDQYEQQDENNNHHKSRLQLQKQPSRSFTSSGDKGRFGGGYGVGNGKHRDRSFQRGGKKPYPSRQEQANNRNKPNFTKQVVEPAERGELRHHQSSIPRLAGRKGKANLGASEWSTTRGAKGGRRWEEIKRRQEGGAGGVGDDGESGDGEDDEERGYGGGGKGMHDSYQDPASSWLNVRPEAPGKPPKFMSQEDDYLAMEELWDDKKYYHNEEDYDDWFEELDNAPKEMFDEEGNLKQYLYTEEDLKPQPHDWLIDDAEENERFMAEFKEWEKQGLVTEERRGRGRPHSRPPMDDSSASEAEAEEVSNEEEEGTADKQEADIWAQGKSYEEESNAVLDTRFKKYTKEEMAEDVNPDELFFNSSNDILEIAKRDDSEFPDEIEDDPASEQFNKMVLPLQEEMGVDGTAEDFVTAMQEHPTEYASVTQKAVHPNSLREPTPAFSRNKKHIKQPALEFVENFKRFLYVTGLPPLTVNGEEGDIENPIHKSFLEQLVSDLVDVDTTQISVANTTSAFVGFDSPRALANAIKDGPTRRTLTKVPVLRKYDPAAILETRDAALMNEFVESSESPDSIMHLSDLPSFNTPESLSRELIPSDSELSTEFGMLSADDVFILSRSNALIRLPSAEKADAMLQSNLIQDRLESIGTYPVHYLRARRELLHNGFLYKSQEIRVNGPRLVIDGVHVPSKEFYISHASALLLHDVDPQFLDEDLLNAHFQPYSMTRRIKSNIEFVRCEITGEPILGTVYIGFEETKEARVYNQSCSGRTRIGDRFAKVRVLVDRPIPHRKLDPEIRSKRSLEELEDDLHNWQKHVDPADIEFLDKNGVPRVALNDMLVYIRRKNTYFGTLDGNFRDESVEPDKPMGEEYKELVQLVVKTLKDHVATRDNPGETYLDMFFEDEEPDMKIFDLWEREKVEIDKLFSKYKIGQI